MPKISVGSNIATTARITKHANETTPAIIKARCRSNNSLIIFYLLRQEKPQYAVKQKADRTEHKRQHQTGNYEPVRNSARLGVFDFPRADQQIERKIMNPPGERRPFVREKLHHLGQ